LIVDNNVNGSSNCVVWEGTQMERLVNDALPSKATIFVDQDAHVLCHVSIIGLELLCLRLAYDNRIHILQVTGIGDQGQVDSLATSGGAVVGGTQMVLGIASSGVELILAFDGPRPTSKLAENLRQGLADDIAKHIEPSAVRHPNDTVLNTEVSRPIKHLLHAGDKRLAALRPNLLAVHPCKLEDFSKK
jgi:hypothetical protein